MRKWQAVPHHPGIFTYETKKGTRYGVRRGFKNSEGIKDEFTKSGYYRWRDADAVLKKFESELVSGRINPITHRSVTFDQHFAELKKRKIATKDWRPETVRTKDQIYNSKIKKEFGSRRLNDVSRAEYRQFLDKIIEDGYSHSTLVATNAMMMQLLNDAERMDIIDKNRLKGASLKGGTAPRPVDITPTDYEKWLQFAESTLSDYEFCMVMLLTLGPRREEVYGLQLGSLTKEEDGPVPYYRIEYKKARNPGDLEGGKLKSNSAYRVNYAKSSHFIWLIDNAIATCKLRCERNNKVPNPETFLFLNEQGNPFYISYLSEQIFKPISLRTGITVRPHMLRHYFATQAMQSGAAETTIMHWLGHSDISMTASYTRATKAGALKLIDTMQDTLDPGKNPNKKS